MRRLMKALKVGWGKKSGEDLGAASASQKSITGLEVGMSKKRELLERAYYVLGELSYAMLKDSGEYNLAGDIYEFLSTPEPTQDEEPVAWTCQDELNALGTDVTCYMYAEPLVGETNIPLYLHPAPRPEFVRLSEEEFRSCFTKTNKTEPLPEGWPGLERFARAIEDALEEANRYKPFVRLSEEEVNSLTYAPLEPYELICAVENMLERKNRE